MNNELISVIIPCYNASAHLDDLFLSLNNQTYKNLQIIFVNDGSSDDTLSKLNVFAKTTTFNVQVIDQPNSGPSASRNKGLSVATGKYIYFGDADDIYHPQLIEQLYLAIVNTNSDLVSCGKKRIFNSTKYPNKFRTIKNPKYIEFNSRSELVSTLLSTYKIGFEGFNKLFKHDILKQLPNYPNVWDKTCYYGEDLLLNLQYCTKCSKAIHIDKPLYHYRFSQGSITNSGFNLKRLTYKKVVDFFYTLNQEEFKDSIAYIKTYMCFISVDMLLRMSKTDLNNKEVVKLVYNDFISNWKYCSKAKLAPWYRKHFMWVMVPILKCRVGRKIKK